MHLPPKQENICSISELTSGIKRTLEDAYAAVWVKGEISNLRRQSSGHIYFSLKDAGAQISAVVFRGNAARMKLQLQDGMEIVALGNLSVYEPRGTYQLIIRECIEEGAGRLQAEFERLKRLLNAEGLFSPANKKSIPLLPRTVGIITSPTGAALRDFLSILTRRNWTGKVILFPAVVQGKEGARDILEKMKWAEAYEDLDLLVIGRGGGSLEDLWNFNEEALVRAVAACKTPVISAVGHEIDFVLTDFAADKRAETPSAAAELISSGYVDFHQRIQQVGIALTRSRTEQLREKSQTLSHMGDRLRSHTPTRFVENRHLRLDELLERMRSRVETGVHRSNNGIAVMTERFKSLHPSKLLELRVAKTEEFKLRIRREVQHQLKSEQNRLVAIEKRFVSVSTDSALQRGYAILRDNKGKLVTQCEPLNDGKMVEIQMKDGRRKARIHRSDQLDLFS